MTMYYSYACCQSDVQPTCLWHIRTATLELAATRMYSETCHTANQLGTVGP